VRQSRDFTRYPRLRAASQLWEPVPGAGARPAQCQCPRQAAVRRRACHPARAGGGTQRRGTCRPLSLRARVGGQERSIKVRTSAALCDSRCRTSVILRMCITVQQMSAEHNGGQTALKVTGSTPRVLRRPGPTGSSDRTASRCIIIGVVACHKRQKHKERLPAMITPCRFGPCHSCAWTAFSSPQSNVRASTHQSMSVPTYSHRRRRAGRRKRRFAAATRAPPISLRRTAYSGSHVVRAFYT
jgi:hypothetical protein